MKNFIYMISMFLLSALIAGCSGETNASLNTNEIPFGKKADDTEKNIPAVQIEGKEKKDTVWLKEKALYQLEAADGKLKYTIFLFAEDEQKAILEEDSQKGKKGESYFTGNYSVYLAEKDSAVAYKQDVLKEDAQLAFNPALDLAYTVKAGSKTIISIFQQKGRDLVQGQLLAIKDGELRDINMEKNIITSSGAKIKAVNQKFIQTAQYIKKKNSPREKWIFSTWLFNEETLSMSLHDQEEFQGKNSLGAYWMNIWLNEEAIYYPFKNLELGSDVVEKAKQGIPLGSPYPIGTNISEIKKTDPGFMEEGNEEEVSYLVYPEITYYFERETGNVTAISIPGQRIKTSINEVKALFGNPAEVRNDPASGGTISVYIADKYRIEVLAREDGEVSRVYLTEKNAVSLSESERPEATLEESNK